MLVNRLHTNNVACYPVVLNPTSPIVRHDRARWLQTALIMPHLGKSLASYMDAQIDLLQSLKPKRCRRPAHRGQPYPPRQFEPTNIFLNERGQVFLTDVMTVGLHDVREELGKGTKTASDLRHQKRQVLLVPIGIRGRCVSLCLLRQLLPRQPTNPIRWRAFGPDKVAVAALKIAF